MTLKRKHSEPDFVVDPRPLTREEEAAISAFIQSDKAKNAARSKKKDRSASKLKTKKKSRKKV
jgi:hypothetical protein